MNCASNRTFAISVASIDCGLAVILKRSLRSYIAGFITFLAGAVALAAAGDYPREILPHLFETKPLQIGTDGINVYTIRSEYQSGDNTLDVLTPSVLEPGRRYPLLLVLPVYPGAAAARDGLEAVQRLQLHERFGLVCVSPAFAEMPWYADHPSNPVDRHESHLLRAVLPFVEHCYPVQREAAGRLLVGFSKSGWGAFSLLLRHPDTFSRAASWDAPFMLQQPGRWGTKRLWPTEADFAKYNVTRLLGERAELLRGQPARFALLGYGLFREDDVQVHEQLAALGIPHYWAHGPERKHTWESGWLESAIAALVSADMRMAPSVESRQ